MLIFILGAVAGYAFAQAETFYPISKSLSDNWLLAVVLAIIIATAAC